MRNTEFPATSRSGFTLVELLVVVTIIGILISLLLPAVQAAREAARRTQCSNHLKQISLAFLEHDAAHGFLPTGGWGPNWVGDPLRGFGRSQPGGWLYNILPYLEQGTLYQLPDDGDPDAISSTQRAAAARMCQTPLAMANCPTRRRPALYPYVLPNAPRNADQTPTVARCDYAANSGGDSPGEFRRPGNESTYNTYSQLTGFQWTEHTGQTGVCYYRSETQFAHIRDGASNTYLVGEKYLNSDLYATGQGGGDNHSMYQGHDRDMQRWTTLGIPPYRIAPEPTCTSTSAAPTVPASRWPFATVRSA